jgi:hypothetical protein
VFRILYRGWVKNPDPGRTTSDRISESFDAIFWVKIIKFFDADPGWEKFVSGINLRDPQLLVVIMVLFAICVHLFTVVKEFNLQNCVDSEVYSVALCPKIALS